MPKACCRPAAPTTSRFAARWSPIPHWCLKAFGEVKRPIRHCISCNVCFERLTLELDVACVQNPLVGTEFETLAKARAGA